MKLRVDDFEDFAEMRWPKVCYLKLNVFLKKNALLGRVVHILQVLITEFVHERVKQADTYRPLVNCVGELLKKQLNACSLPNGDVSSAPSQRCHAPRYPADSRMVYYASIYADARNCETAQAVSFVTSVKKCVYNYKRLHPDDVRQ